MCGHVQLQAVYSADIISRSTQRWVVLISFPSMPFEQHGNHGGEWIWNKFPMHWCGDSGTHTHTWQTQYSTFIQTFLPHCSIVLCVYFMYCTVYSCVMFLFCLDIHNWMWNHMLGLVMHFYFISSSCTAWASIQSLISCCRMTGNCNLLHAVPYYLGGHVLYP